jgi:TolB protein
MHGGNPENFDDQKACVSVDQFADDDRDAGRSLSTGARFILAALLFASLEFAAIAAAQGKPIGGFDDHADIGAPKIAGDAVFDAGTHRYILTAGGANMFHDHDEFHFVWRKLSGDFILRARVKFLGEGVEAHRKAGLMARSSLDAGAAYVDGVIHGHGPTALQTRRTGGADTEMMVTAAPTESLAKLLGSATKDADYLQLERRGNTYIVSIAKFGQPFTQQRIADIDLGREIYVGLFLCAHNADVSEKAVFSDVHTQRMDAARATAHQGTTPNRTARNDAS